MKFGFLASAWNSSGLDWKKNPENFFLEKNKIRSVLKLTWDFPWTLININRIDTKTILTIFTSSFGKVERSFENAIDNQTQNGQCARSKFSIFAGSLPKIFVSKSLHICKKQKGWIIAFSSDRFYDAKTCSKVNLNFSCFLFT